MRKKLEHLSDGGALCVPLERPPNPLLERRGVVAERILVRPVVHDERLVRSDRGFRRGRARAAGGGRKAKLALEEQLLVALMCYRLYLTQLLLGYLFDLDDSNVSRIVTKLRPLLLAVLPLPVQEKVLFADGRGAKKRIATLDELLHKHPEFKEVLIDATELKTYKPKDKAKRKGRYSGKKKRHTLKT